MKKYLKPAIALCLVAALAVGGTLAYLTDSTDSKVNEFTVDESIDIELNESDNDWTLTPGTTQEKDPAITVLADSSYVFIEVVETIPTAAIADGNDSGTDNDYSFSDYVVYSINGEFTGTVGTQTTDTAGGTVYSYDSTTSLPSDTATSWYWSLVSTSTSKGTDTYSESDDTYTTVTYVYALVDSTGNLLSVSSLDGSEASTAPTTGKEVDYPILTDDEVTIPTTVTSEMMALLETSEEGVYYSVDLTFTGYAIQTEGLDDLTTNADIYEAASGKTVSTYS
ncbi:MAG: SipW-dependent-type signal peptide-containing protein [Clostridia bacterium]